MRLTVLLALAVSWRGQYVEASMKGLAEVTGRDESRVREALRFAQRAGYLHKIARGHRLGDGSIAPSRYVLTIPAQPVPDAPLDDACQPVPDAPLEADGIGRSSGRSAGAQAVPDAPLADLCKRTRNAAAASRIDELQDAHRAVGLTADWRRVRTDPALAAEVTALADVHGINRMVEMSRSQYRPHNPAVHATAWLAAWRSMVPPKSPALRCLNAEHAGAAFRSYDDGRPSECVRCIEERSDLPHLASVSA
jgi:hypothetical protein